MAETVVIPGDPGGLQALASQLRGAGDDVLSVRERIATNGLQGAWNGQASDAFRATLHSLPGELDKIVSAFGESASAVGSFASRLEELQQAAAWQNQQLARAEEELRAAQARATREKANVAAAQRAHDSMTDPISKSTAARALSSSQSLLRQASSDIEDVGSQLGRLAGSGDSLMGEYRNAVNAATNALRAARHSAGRSWSAWAGHFAHDVLRHAEHFVGTAFHAARDAMEDALKEFNDHWEGIRRLLTDATIAVGILAMVVLVVGSGGTALPLAIAMAGVGLSEATMLGDEAEAFQGKEEDKRRLGGDSFDLGLSLLGLGGALKAVDDAAKLTPAAARLAEREATGIEGGYVEKKVVGGVARRFAPGLIAKLRNLGEASKTRLSLANEWLKDQAHDEVHHLIDERDGVRDERSTGINRYLDELSKGPTSLVIPLELAAAL